MDNLRSMISNLDIYQTSKPSSDLQNQYYNNYHIQKPISSNPSSKWSPEPYPLPIKNINDGVTKVIQYKYPSKSSPNKLKHNKSNDYLYNQEYDYITRNKELIHEQEQKLREDRLRKENEALKLLLMNKRPNSYYSYVNPRVYDIKQPTTNKKKVNSRSKSPQHKTIDKSNINYVGGLYSVVDLPRIPSSLQTSQQILHKDFGRTPEYLEKMKAEYEEQKKEKKLREREKKLPKGTRFLPEEIKQKRTQELNDKKQQLENELYKMPITRLSLKMIQKKSEIEKELNDIETELRRLSYKEVVIQDY